MMTSFLVTTSATTNTAAMLNVAWVGCGELMEHVLAGVSGRDACRYG